MRFGLSCFALAVATVLAYAEDHKPADAFATAHRGADVALIANWVSGKDPAQVFIKPFGDGKILADSKDLLLYTDISGVETPAGMKAVNYESIQARMRMIRSGHSAAPAVLIVRSSLEEPVEDGSAREIRVDEGKSGGRVYYVEVAIGNLAWHSLKVVVHGEGEKAKADVLWHRQS